MRLLLLRSVLGNLSTDPDARTVSMPGCSLERSLQDGSSIL